MAIFSGDVERLSDDKINELMKEQVEDKLADAEPESEVQTVQPVHMNQQQEENLLEEWTKKGWL